MTKCDGSVIYGVLVARYPIVYIGTFTCEIFRIVHNIIGPKWPNQSKKLMIDDNRWTIYRARFCDHRLSSIINYIDNR